MTDTKPPGDGELRDLIRQSRTAGLGSLSDTEYELLLAAVREGRVRPRHLADEPPRPVAGSVGRGGSRPC